MYIMRVQSHLCSELVNKQRGSSPTEAAWRRELQTYPGHLNLYGKEICLPGQHYLWVVSMVACSGRSIQAPSLPKKKKSYFFFFNEELLTYSCCSINLFDRSDWHFPSHVTALTGHIYWGSFVNWWRNAIYTQIPMVAGKEMVLRPATGEWEDPCKRRCWLSLGKATSTWWRLG